MGRLWQTLHLAKWNEIFTWVPMELVLFENKKQYYQAIEGAREANDSGVFIEFALSMIQDALTILGKHEKSASYAGDKRRGHEKFVENADEFVEKCAENETQRAIIRLMIDQPTISAKKISEIIGMSPRGVQIGTNCHMYVKRHIEEAVLRRAKMKGAVVVTGARQVGKTTLIENIKPDIPKITFDDLPTRHRAHNSPSTFFNINPPPIFVDEVQYAPEIFHYIKILLDNSHKKGEFFLTGSQSFEPMQNVTESLAGRTGILELMGLSLREMNNDPWNRPFLPTFSYLKERNENKTNLSIPEIWKTIHRGCLPELALNADFDWADFYADYIKTYIERDVRRLTQVADEDSFYKFTAVCAAMSGQLLNLAKLADDVGISVPTAKRWLSVLKTSGIVYLLMPYSNNAIKRAVKTPKLHFLDIGLASYLTRWTTSENLAIGANNGSFFESFVVSEILGFFFIKSTRNFGVPLAYQKLANLF